MASTFSIISTVFLTTGVLFIMQGVALVVLYVTKWRSGRPGTAKGEDHANMMILFQSMRDLLEEQKRLARQLNEDIDRKLTRINLVVHDALDSARRAPSQSPPAKPAYSPPARPPMGESQSERDARAAFLQAAKKVASHAGADGGNAAPNPDSAGPRSHAAVPPRAEDPPEAFRALPDEAQHEEPTGEKFDAWVGLDFGGDTPDPYRVEVPEQPPAAPEDAEKAREAFRSLLGLQQDSGQGVSGGGASARKAAAPTASGGAANGAHKRTPLQRRVQEYADAGMSVPQIARELGIGKGEVRLILSLREGRKV